MILIVYQKKDKIESHLVKHTFRKVGERTSMGWTVLSIQKLYKGRFYIESNYMQRLFEDRERVYKRNQKIKKIVNVFHSIFS